MIAPALRLRCFVTHDIEEAIYPAGRTVVIPGRPGRMREIIAADLPRPRRHEMRSDARFVALRDRAAGIVREEAT